MRTIFLALIVLNFVYFGWNYYQSSESSFKTPPTLGRDVKILTLLSESGEEPDAEFDNERRPMEDYEIDDSASEEMLTFDEKERCYSLGPFKNLSDAEHVMANIEGRGLSVTNRSTTSRVKKGYWVHIPPLTNREAALRVARELANKGIEDYLVITKGKNENAVSLGLYSMADSAKRRLNRIRALGYKPVQEIRYKDATEYWLDYREVGETDLPTEFWELLAYAEDKLQRLERDCLISTEVVSKSVQ